MQFVCEEAPRPKISVSETVTKHAHNLYTGCRYLILTSILAAKIESLIFWKYQVPSQVSSNIQNYNEKSLLLI